MGRPKRPWTKVWGNDLRGSTRFMALGIGTRGIWFELATMLADDHGLVYANLDRSGAPVPYRTVELAAELGISESTWRSARDRMLDPNVDLLVAHRTPAGTIFQVTRFDAKAKPESREKTRRTVADLLSRVLASSRDLREGEGESSASLAREQRAVSADQSRTYEPGVERHGPSESETETEKTPKPPTWPPPPATRYAGLGPARGHATEDAAELSDDDLRRIQEEARERHRKPRPPPWKGKR